MSTQPTFGMVLEYVSDITAVKQFYVDVVGLEVEREAPVFVQFKDKAGSYFAIASDEAMGNATDPEVYWLVDDAEAALDDLSKKTTITMPLKTLPFGKVFGVTDPAGYPRYLLEWAKERPSTPSR